jgi:hypothetical protein
LYTTSVSLDGNGWSIAIDPKDQGRDQKWFEVPVKGARPIWVPGVIQLRFPDYHGLAWYWRDFEAPVNPHTSGRYLLRFHSVDYIAEVWVNGMRVGSHEGGQEPFVLDATAAIKPEKNNRLAVRVLNPTHQPIDGVVLEEVAEGRRDYPNPLDNAYDTGGIVGSVELLVAPVLRVADLYVIPDWKTGDLYLRVSVQNAGGSSALGRLLLTAAPASTGQPVVAKIAEQHFPPGDGLVEATLHIENHRLWELEDPYLYQVTVGIHTADGSSIDQRSVRCGFRDFRFENGYFRFNGRRIRLHGALYTILQYPIEQIIPYQEQWLRRDVLYAKSMGFNMLRITCGPALPRQLDILDEIGLLAYEEHYGARVLAESPYMEERWDRSIASVVRRDRNHPSIVMWGMLNEAKDGRLFRHAVKALHLVRELDDTRVVMLNSGRFDRDHSIGSFSNPGSSQWEGGLRDVHAYPDFPHTAEIIRTMRSPNLGKMPGVFLGSMREGPFLLSEYGVCGAQDYPRFMRHFESLGKDDAPDARLFRAKLERFLSDWEKWRLDQCWARPEDYFRESQANQAKLALDDYNAWLSNPALIGDLTSTQVPDAWFHGCGIANYFRELKPGMADAFNDMAAKTRWCLFAEPVNVYRGSKVRLEAVLVNHSEELTPGKFPVHLQVVGPKMTSILDRTIDLEITGGPGKPESSFVLPAFAGELTMDGPSGKYRFIATFQRGVPAGGGEAELYVAATQDMPGVPHEIVLWGEDGELRNWLLSQGLRVRRFDAANAAGREIILASGRPPVPGGAEAFATLARHVARGSTVVFLTYHTLAERGMSDKTPIPLRWAPFPQPIKPSIGEVPAWYFRADYWAKDHPIFDGLPCGGIMNYTFYRDILSARVFTGLHPPLEAVCGALDTTKDYHSDLLVSIHELGHGRFILNSLKIRENLGQVPAAEHLLRNMLNLAASDTTKPLNKLPPDFDHQLNSMGYIR